MTELDPRTYASASKKRNEQGNTKAGWKLKNKAIDSWNKKYAILGDKTQTDFGGQLTRKKNLGGLNSSDYIYDDDTFYSSQDNTKHHSNFNRWELPIDDNKPFSKSRWSMNNDDEPEITFNNNREFETNDEGLKVAQQMANGKGEYVKGKGWK